MLVNKWDAVEKDNDTMNQFTAKVRKDLNFLDYVPILFISAKTGQRVDQVLPLALKVQEERLARLTTADRSNEAFPFMRSQQIDVAGVPCIALRVSFTGDLGW